MNFLFFFFSRQRRETRFLYLSWAWRWVGRIGEALREVVRHPRLRGKLFVMETERGETHDAHNLATLRRWLESWVSLRESSEACVSLRESSEE